VLGEAVTACRIVTLGGLDTCLAHLQEEAALAPGEDCRWITKNGRPICITGGHERQHAKETARQAAADLGGMTETSNPGGAFYKNVTLTDDGGRKVQRQITLKAAAPGQSGFKVTVLATFETSLGGNSIATSFSFPTIEAAKRFVQHASTQADLRTFHEAAAALQEAPLDPGDACRWITKNGHPICIGGTGGHASHGPDQYPSREMSPEAKAWLEEIQQNPWIAKGKAMIQGGQDTMQQYRHADGTWDPARAALHEEIVQGILNPQAMPDRKSVV